MEHVFGKLNRTNGDMVDLKFDNGQYVVIFIPADTEQPITETIHDTLTYALIKAQHLLES